MPNNTVSFANQTLVVPGVYVQTVPGIQLGSQTPAPPLLVIASSNGGLYNTPYSFTSLSDFQQFVRGGNVSKYIPFMANPGPGLAGASNIVFLNASQNTASTLTFGGVLTLTSTNVGTPSNLLQASLALDSNYPSDAMTMVISDNYAQTQIVGTGLGVPMTLAYTGTATSGVSFTVNSLAGGNFVLASPNSGESFTFPFSGYTDVSELIEAINGTGFYVAQIYSSTEGELPTTDLTVVSNVALSSTPTPVTAGISDALYWVNNFAQSYCTAASTGSTWPLSAAPLTNFTGATTVAPTSTNYQACLQTALNNVNAFVMWMDTNVLANQVQAAINAKQASLPVPGKFRRYVTGSTLGMTSSAAIQAAQTLNSKETVFCYPGIMAVNTSTGLTNTYDGNYVAAMVASAMCGNPIPTPLTNKQLQAQGVEQVLSQSTIASLMDAGVMVIQTVNAIPTILRDLDTWQADNNVVNTSTQQVACRQWASYSLINAISPYVGTIAAPQTLAQIKKNISATLNSLIWGASNPNGVLASWDANSLVIQYVGQTFTLSVTVNVALVGQIDFVPITVNVSAYNSGS